MPVTIDSYNTFEAASPELGKLIWPFLQKNLNVKGKKCIEIGSKNGSLCGKLREWGAEFVVGLDSDEKFVESAKKTYHKEVYGFKSDVKDIQFLHGDVSNIKKLYMQFDVAVAVNSLLYSDTIMEIYQTLSELAKFIYEGGLVAIVVPNRDGASGYGTTLKLEENRYQKRYLKGEEEIAKEQVFIHPPEAYVECLEAAGFEKVETKLIHEGTSSEEEIQGSFYVLITARRK